jgi:hypothetical protein
MSMPVPTVLLCEDRSIVEDLLDTISSLETGLKSGTHPVKPIREARREADATGVWFGSSQRVVHRVGGLSKATPPLDPFRTGPARRRKADEVQRGDPNGIVRRELHHVDPDGFETTIALTGGTHAALFPDGNDAAWRMRVQLGMISDIVKEARFATSHPAPRRVAARYACGVLDAIREPPIRGAFVRCTMPSPLAHGRHVIAGIPSEDVDDEIMPVYDPQDWPHAMSLLYSRTDTSRTWTLTQAIGEQRLVDLDPMERLRIVREGMPSYIDYLEHGERLP